MPARCSALTMSRNSSSAPSGSDVASCSRGAGQKKRPAGIPNSCSSPGGRIVLVEREDRQQLDGSDAQILQIGNLLDQPGISSALGRCDAELGCRVKPPTCIS